MRCVHRAGWHGSGFVLPDGRVFGGDGLVMQSDQAPDSAAYAARGTLNEWCQHVARYAEGNDLLTLAISAAFAAPLLDIVGDASGGVHFYGRSQTGKTTLLRAAASVWGPGDGGLLRTWRATANGLEAVMVETSDGLLLLDEINQADAPELTKTVYMLANQRGKARANPSGGARPTAVWRVLALSSGEETVATKVAEARKHVHAGVDVRLLNLPADGGCGHGVWQVLHEQSNGAAVTNTLRRTSVAYCGTAGPAFLAKLTKDRADEPELLATTLRNIRGRFHAAARLPATADGQVQSAAARLGLIAAAGELAIGYGILPWQPEAAIKAARECLERWVAARGGSGAAEDIAALRAVRAFISAHGSARFEPADQPPPNKWGDVLSEPRISNRAGYVRELVDGTREFLILPSVCGAEVCRDLNPRDVAHVLKRNGFLLGTDARHLTDQVRVRGHPNPLRFYRVPGAILENSDE
jgi:uncharacterized protein (DUF927 family)